ncbi:MAG: hemolysin family protein [Myxococcota bacterium]
MDASVWEGLRVALCVAGYALLSGTESALTSLSVPQAQRIAEERNLRSLQHWIDQPVRVLTAILTGKTLLASGAAIGSALIAQRMTPELPPSAPLPLLLSLLLIALLLLVVGELIPRTLAQHAAARLSNPAMFALRPLVFVLTPITWVFTGLTRLLMRMLGSTRDHEEPLVTAEEIEYMIDLGSRAGTFSADRERMLRSVFDFSDTVVREVMVPRPDMVTLPVDMELAEVLEVMRACGHSRIPVFEDNVDNIVGVFYVKDLFTVLHDTHVGDDLASDFDLAHLMRQPYTTSSNELISDLFATFKRERMHIAIVKDEFGGTDGIITLEDIIEEFFGEIQDEYDEEEDEHMTPVHLDLLRADARAPIWEVGEYFGVDLTDADGNYDTLAGYILDRAGFIPSVDEEIVTDGFVFRVLDADDKRIKTVEIERLEHQDHDARDREPIPG